MLPRGADHVPDLNPDQISRYERLAAQRREINRKINDLLRDAPLVARPTWGPCTRCGNKWRGTWPQRKPKCCAKCGNLYWDVPYSSYEAEQAAKAAKIERSRLNDVRMLTGRAQRDEVAAALEVLHRHGVTVPPSALAPSKSNGRSGLTPPPPSILETMVSHAKGSGGSAAPSASVVGAQEIGDHDLDEEAPDAEIPAHRQSEDETPASGELPPDTPDMPNTTCCDSPFIVEGICLNCGAGLEKKVTIDDSNEQ